jgi:hypothetical protein
MELARRGHTIAGCARNGEALAELEKLLVIPHPSTREDGDGAAASPRKHLLKQVDVVWNSDQNAITLLLPSSFSRRSTFSWTCIVPVYSDLNLFHRLSLPDMVVVVMMDDADADDLDLFLIVACDVQCILRHISPQIKVWKEFLSSSSKPRHCLTW